MIRLRRWLPPLMAGCLLATMAGGSSSGASPGSVALKASYVSGPPAGLNLAGTGISLKPVPDRQPAPPISGSQALRTCVTGASLCDPALIPNVYPALAEKPESGMSWQLVWVIDYPDSTCVPFGLPPARPALRAPYRCRLVNLVDSNTGRTLWSVRF